ncbi:MAG: glycosyltransferase family 4 protein [Candidatus Omnitrophica bacterium]|jgi:glycosyltransferase involved in cell wall biosynthesis|nr:glycosyltransferase family 4 protein [Candidatus Omnitrophota bacterium]
MNILYLTTHLNVGGITSYLLTLAQGFKARGHTVYVASAGGDSAVLFSTQGVIHIPIPIRTKSELNIFKLGLSAVSLARQLAHRRIDVIHSHTRVTQVLGSLAQKYIRAPHVTTCHGFFKKRFSRIVLPFWGDKVIAISDQVKEHLMFDLKVPERNIRLVYNGINTEFFAKAANINPDERRAMRDEMGLGDGPVIGIIARLSDVKGHQYLIRAMKAVLERRPDSILLIAGEGPMERRLIELTRELGIEKNVLFVPNVIGTAKTLSMIDIYVSPSLNEGLGLSLMEAMAAGVPCIGSDVGGIRSLIRHGDNGILVKPADPEGIACAILELLADPGKSKGYSDKAQLFINRYFSQAEMLLRTEEVYRECLNTKS